MPHLARLPRGAKLPPALLPALCLVLLLVACGGDDPRPDDEPDDESYFGRASIGLTCEPDDFYEPERHGLGRPRPTTISAGLQRRLCSAAQVLPDASELVIPAQSFAVQVQPAPIDTLPALVDSNSPAFRSGQGLRMLNSAWGATYLSTGNTILDLAEPMEVLLPRPDRPGNVWIEAAWREPTTGLLYGWYHFEPEDIGCMTAPIIGAAVSFDDGLTWEDRGFVLENGYPVDCEFGNGWFVGGNGDFSVVVGPNGRNLYFLFSNYQGPLAEQGIGIARSTVEDRGLPGTVFKYYQGRWDEPGLGGRSTAIFGTFTGWSTGEMDVFWGPSVHFNNYLQSYVVLLNRAGGIFWEQEGIYVSFSRDLLNWSTPVKILETNEFYPQIVGLGAEGTDKVAGQFARLYVGGISEFILEFVRPPAN